MGDGGILPSGGLASAVLATLSGMKAIKVTLDEALLDRLDRLPAVQEQGRSAVLREAVADYLTRKEAEEIERRYREGYRTAPSTEFEEWTGQGVSLT